MRTFVAIDPSKRLRESLQEVCGRVRDADLHWAAQRWTRPENYHLTVRFFGDLQSEVCEAVVRDLHEHLVGIGKFELPVAEALTDLSRGTKISLMMTIFSDAEGKFARVKRVVDGVASVHGFPPDLKEAIPHVTLVRTSGRGLRRPSPDVYAQASRCLAGESICVDELSVYSSELGKDGPRYTRLAKIRLKH